ncbi:MAG: GatB/YqeY domain-containing protein [Dehalococcoidia bacterium]|nr:GatB/YqeY domain-containing protein [Dehalococcoidia bacterium]
MTLKDQLEADLRDALRSRDETRKNTLRMLLTAIHNAEIPPEHPETAADAPDSVRADLDDAGVTEIIRKQVKQRRDSIDAYSKANRPDLVAIEEAEAVILGGYLPAQMSRDEIAAIAREVITRVGASGPADKGKVMPVVMSELAGKAEGRDINAVVTELLTQT